MASDPLGGYCELQGQRLFPTCWQEAAPESVSLVFFKSFWFQAGISTLNSISVALAQEELIKGPLSEF